MQRKRKYVYSVTLHEEVAEWLRGLTDSGKLSPGIARAQELLVQAGISTRPESLFRTAPARTLAAPELAEIEQACFAESQAAYDAQKPLPDHMRLMGRGLGRVRERVLDRCEKAFGWRHGPVPPHIVLPTDNPFDDVPTSRQRPPEDPAGGAISSRIQPDPPGDAGTETSGADPAGPAAPASTADSSVTSDSGRSELEGVAEPQF